MKVNLLKKLIDSNKYVYSDKNKDRKRNILIDVQTNDLFLVTTIMRLSFAFAKSLNYNVVVIPSVKATSDTISLIKSYSPHNIINTRKFVLKSFVKNFKVIMNILLKLKSGRDLVDFAINGNDIGKHIYDSLLRRMSLPTIEKLSVKQKAFMSLDLSFYFFISNFVENEEINYALILDKAYRNGVIFEVLKDHRIPCVAGICVNDFSMHKYNRDDDYDENCRKPDCEVVDKIFKSTKLYSGVKEYLDNRFSGNEIQHDLIRAYSKNKRTINISELCEEYNIDSTKKTVIVMAHIFCDAPHAEPGMLFSDYVEWFEETCVCLKKNKFVNFLVKEHPSVDIYGERGIIETILRRNDLQSHLLSKDINTKSLFNCVDVLVTCGGTAGAEFPCFGVPVVVAATPPYSYLPFIYTSSNKNDYLKLLYEIQNIKKLSLEEIKLAQCAMYVMYVIMKLDKSKFGFTSQIYSPDNHIDYELLMNEVIDANNNTSMHNKFNYLIDEFMNSKFKNLYDYSKIE